MSYEQIRRSSLRRRLKFLAADSVLYGGAAALTRGMSLILLPILTRVLSAGEYGALDVISITAALLAAFAIMGQDSAVARFFYETDDEDTRRSIVGQALLVQLGLSAGLAVAGVLLVPVLAPALLRDGTYGLALTLAMLGIPALVVLQFARNLLKWVFARRAFMAVSLGSVFLVVVLSLVAVLYFGAGVTGVVAAHLIGNAISAVVALYLTRRYVAWPTAWTHVRSMLAFGWPYMLVATLGGLVPAMDRQFVTHGLGLSALGAYAVGFKLSFMLAIAVTAFQTAWNPMALAIYREADASETYDRVLKLYAVVMAVVASTLAIMAPTFVGILAPAEYAAASIVVLPLAFALVVESSAWIAGLGVDLSKRTHFTVISYAAGLMIMAGAISILMPRFGLVGVGYGVLAGKCAQAALHVFFAWRSWPLRLDLATPAAAIGLGLAAGWFVTRIVQPGLAGALLWCAALCIPAGFALHRLVQVAAAGTEPKPQQQPEPAATLERR